jgi:hypothetical protein
MAGELDAVLIDAFENVSQVKITRKEAFIKD